MYNKDMKTDILIFLLKDVSSPYQSQVQAAFNNKKLSGVKTCQIFTVKLLQVVTKTSPDLILCLQRRRPTQEYATPCSSGCVILYYTPVINLDRRPPSGPTHTVHTRLKPLAQWCFYSYAYSSCSFSPRPISKSNFFFNRRKNWFKIAQAKPSWSHYFPRVSRKGHSRRIHMFQVKAQGWKPMKELNLADAKTNANSINLLISGFKPAHDLCNIVYHSAWVQCIKKTLSHPYYHILTE